MDEKIYEKMDQICDITYKNIFTLVNSSGNKDKKIDYILLNRFNPKDESHLFFLHVADTFASFNNVRVVTKLGFFQTWLLNYKEDLRLNVLRYRKSLIGKSAILYVDDILEFERVLLKDELEGYTFTNIYNTYFKKEK